jgi:histidyl-tRNA synthetase
MGSIPTATEFLKAGANAAHHFGFTHHDVIKDAVRNDPACKAFEGGRQEHNASAADRKLDSLHGMLTSGACAYFDSRFYTRNGPVLFYTTDSVPRTGESAVSLHIVNVQKSIAEAILIQTVRAFISDLGYDNHIVRVNSLGDQDSVARYTRELTSFMRKRIDELPVSARELMREHVFDALIHLIEKEHELADKSPNPMEYLSDQSRRHFREIVEYLDMSDTPYEIDPKLIGHHQCYSDTLFAIDLKNENAGPLPDSPLYIRGGRYDTFVSRMSKVRVPAAGAVIVLRDRRAPLRQPRMTNDSVSSIFMVQLGFAPKIKSLLIIEALRRAGISVHQDIVSDSLGAQLKKAEDGNIRYAIIIGQKEYVDNMVILRDLKARNQELVPIPSLVAQLKRMVR